MEMISRCINILGCVIACILLLAVAWVFGTESGRWVCKKIWGKE